MVKKPAKCPSCGKGSLREQRVKETMFGADLGEFGGEVCDACGESYLDEAAMRVLEERAREAGVWGLGRKLKVARSGNSLVLRIPADLASFLNLKAGREVYMHPEGEGRIVVDIEG